MKNKLEIAAERYAEMEARKENFIKKYAATRQVIYLELANVETENMNKLALAIMEAKKEEKIKMEKELVEELDKRRLEFFDEEELELAAEYIITTRTVKPLYTVNQYITDILRNYPEMLFEQ